MTGTAGMRRTPAFGATGPRVLLAHPSTELYGSDRVLLESATAFLQAGWRVTVTLPDHGPLVAELAALGIDVMISPTVVLRKAFLRPRGLAALVAAFVRSTSPSMALLRRLRPDLVYVNTVTLPLWSVLAKLRGVPLLVHVHEAEDDVPRPVRVGLAAPLLLADSVVVNSKASAETLCAAISSLRRRIVLLYNGVPGPIRVSPVSPRLSGPIRVVLVGRLSARKGTDVAIDAITRLRAGGRDVTLDLVGSVFSGYEWFDTQLREQVAAAGLESAVRFNGFTDSVWSAYEAADLAIVPSRVEPFGNASVEAQLAGRPVIVTATQGLPETVESSAAAVVVAPGDADALATAIAHVIDHWPAAAAAAAVARNRACQRFGTLRYARELVAIADRLLPTAPVGAGVAADRHP